MGRKILFITTDMMRWNAMGYYGDPYAQTPNLDRLASEGIRYDAARNQNPLCMPCRNSLITGQYPRTNGSWNNGIPLPHDTTTIANVLHDEAGYRTALIGKAHWEPFSSPISMESDLGVNNRYGPLRGFDFAKLQAHGSVPANSHYNIWLRDIHPEFVDEYCQLLDLSGEHSEMIVQGGREYSFTQYESHTPDASIIMNSMFANGIKCVLYERSKTYDGTEGELYDLNEDPGEQINLWDDPTYQGVKADMIETIRTDLLARPMFHNRPIPGALI